MLLACVPAFVALIAMETKQEYKDACRLIREYTRQKDQQAVEAAILADDQQPAEPTHPVHALAQRVRKLAAAEPRIPQLVDQVCARFDQLQAELGSLQQAMAAEETLGSGPNPRLERLSQVAQYKSAEQQALTDAIRDLHVELTEREGRNPDAICGQIDELLASLAAEAEVAQLTGQAPVAATGGQQDSDAHHERDKAQRQQQKPVQHHGPK